MASAPASPQRAPVMSSLSATMCRQAPVGDDVPAGAFDDAGGDGPAAGQGGGVVQVRCFVGQVGRAGVRAGAVGGVQAGFGGLAAYRAGDLGRFAGEDGAGLVLDPGLGGGVTFVVEAPGCLPEVFQHVDEVDQDGDLDATLACFGGDAVDLVVVAVDELAGAFLAQHRAQALETLP